MTDLHAPIWEQQADEPDALYADFLLYLSLGKERTFTDTYTRAYPDRAGKIPSTRWLKVPQQWQWRTRAEAYDLSLVQQAHATYEDRRLAILTSGFALEHERIDALNALAYKLMGYINDDTRLWVTSVKQFGSGKTAQKIEETTFNEALVKQFRGVLDDIAREVGQRVQKRELTGKDGTPLSVHIYLPEQTGETVDTACSPADGSPSQGGVLLLDEATDDTTD